MLDLRIEGESQGHPVLGDIFVSVAPGDHICLLGPSGIGKTSLLNAIAGLDPAISAQAILGREDVRVGYLFQEHRLLPWRTVRQNLALVGASPGEVDTLLTEVGLEGNGDHFPDQLSLGMARRAALARCLAVRPDLLLLDEPFASLDHHRAVELRALIASLLNRHTGMVMICVTHDAEDVGELANRIWYLDGCPAKLQLDDRISDATTAARIVGRLRQSA
ncbi:NitT/TauT family transport system ATP-binding protein [Marinobacter daqiaonensis]|uniref:NitT/TauT family transport system ATP-binding protein n=1 Tax=Marinobacter daqiaonensis TaxID=650891 RepID=A0A1I6HYY5_9GAMM|nr:ATP-binding cassette domain-containing protein [Marinobacter daqiaonensis]SFR59675.1 NitT/TauT family transport system ATP-binding protein [Marinobacter daqiaonensis]